MTREETIQGLENIESRAIDFPYMTASDWVAIAAAKRHLTNSIEVKEVGMSVLDNGNMPIERWKEACEAASCHANYRKSKGLTETCDDYFVDGVQWADEHPIKAKEVDLEKEDLLKKAISWFETIADDTMRITSGNLPHSVATTRGRAIRAAEFLKKHFEETPQEELDKEWKEIEPLNDIGPDVLEYANKK